MISLRFPVPIGFIYLGLYFGLVNDSFSLFILIIDPHPPVLICPETTGINFIKEIALRYKKPQSAWRRWRSKKNLS